MDSNRFTEMGPWSLAGRPPEEGWHQALPEAVPVDAATTRAGRFGHDCNIFSMIATDDTRPMPYTSPHRKCCMISYPCGRGGDRLQDRAQAHRPQGVQGLGVA
jgi:hypothetical protein